ncbi:hypothetical protein [Parafilimonas sp.]|uniref:hypothetical protein n=1 Tax=Parafilimonas sp. TaxID=1969739 RepID=UPI003F822BEB
MLYILIVLYNKPLQNADTLRGLAEASSLLKNMGALIFLWDNSPVALSDHDKNLLNQKFLFQYHHCPANKPLSFVYNEAIEQFMASEEYKYFVILDDDSKISPEYFYELQNITNSDNNPDIILPVAKNNGMVISPAKLFFVKGIYFKTIKNGIYKGKLLAVNSGMAISKAFISKNNFRYDSRLLSYGTDNYIMNLANSKHAIFFIMKTVFEHGYSFYDNSDLKKKVEVFSKIKKANKIVFSLTFKQVCLISVYNFMSSVKNALKYRSLKFFS